MSFRRWWLVILAGCCTLAQAHARPPCVTSTTVSSSGLTLTPFAIPVAVPVATLGSPGLLYRVRDEASMIPARLTDRPVEPTTAARIDIPALLIERCGSCHRGAAPPGGLTLLDAQGSLLAKLPRRRIFEAVAPDDHGHVRMPPAPRASLTREELERLAAWAEPPRELEY